MEETLKVYLRPYPLDLTPVGRVASEKAPPDRGQLVTPLSQVVRMDLPQLGSFRPLIALLADQHEVPTDGDALSLPHDISARIFNFYSELYTNPTQKPELKDEYRVKTYDAFVCAALGREMPIFKPYGFSMALTDTEHLNLGSGYLLLAGNEQRVGAGVAVDQNKLMAVFDTATTRRSPDLPPLVIGPAQTLSTLLGAKSVRQIIE